MDEPISEILLCIHQYGPKSKNLHSLARSRYWMTSKRPATSVRRQGRTVKGSPCVCVCVCVFVWMGGFACNSKEESGSLLVPLKKDLTGFGLKKFSTNYLLEIIVCHSEHFVNKEKDGNHLLQDLVNTVDGVEQTSLNPFFFLRDSFWMWLRVIIKIHKYSVIDERRTFFK